MPAAETAVVAATEGEAREEAAREAATAAVKVAAATEAEKVAAAREVARVEMAAALVEAVGTDT